MRHGMVSFSRCGMVLALIAALTACSAFDEEEKKLEGERIAILSDVEALSPSESLADLTVELPEPQEPADWPQSGGNTQHHTDHVAVAESLSKERSAQVGEGEKWPSSLIAAPVVSSEAVFALDAGGHVSAHTRDLGTHLWTSQTAIADGTDPIGGGLAYSENRVFGTLAPGKVFALDAANGKVLWKKSLHTPVRSAPAVAGDVLLVISAESQLFALDAATGNLLWRHRGIQEPATLLGTVIPAVEDDRVVVAYPSGEIYALSLKEGTPLWSDSLILPQRTTALGTFSGIGGDPVIADNFVYTVSQNGLLASNDLTSGLRIWEQPISSHSTPWVAGEFLFVVTPTRQVVCLYRRDGRIKWVGDLPAADEPESLGGPYLISGRLVVTGSGGRYYTFDPATGTPAGDREFHSGAISAAAFAGGAMYFTDRNATLYAVR